MIFYKVDIGNYGDKNSISKISLNKHIEFINELNDASNQNNGYYFGQIHVRYFRTLADAKAHVKEYPNGAHE